MTVRKKVIITIFLSFILICLNVFIFKLSSQNGTTSTGVSSRFTKAIVSSIDYLTGSKMNNETLENLAGTLEGFIRKAAHFSEYAFMGILFTGIFLCYFRKRTTFLFSTMAVCISAIVDEFHQFFVPGRCASFFDVLIDTTGSMCGSILLIGIITLFVHIKRRKQSKTSCS